MARNVSRQFRFLKSSRLEGTGSRKSLKDEVGLKAHH